MGISHSSIKFLMKEGLRKPYRGSALCIGMQDVLADYSQLMKLARSMNFNLYEVPFTFDLFLDVPGEWFKGPF